MGRNRHVGLLLRAALYAAPLLLAIVARLTLPSFFEFESQEDTVRAVAIFENGELPLYGIGHVRFLGAALGPLVYYLKAIPYMITPDPAGELAFLFILHLAAMVFAMLLTSAVTRDILASQRSDLSPGKLTMTGDLAAFFAGILLALSLHSLGLTSHAHPSYYAAAFMVPFLYGTYRYLLRSGDTWLILAGICFGFMTQLYQLTLFAPVLLLVLILAIPRRPTRKDAARFLVPVAICYLPYFLSELLTGFWNTMNFFSFEAGPQDASMVQTSTLDNLMFLANTFVEYLFLPCVFDGLFLVLGLGGLLILAATVRRARGGRFMLVFILFYCLLPAFFLGAPRFQLALPAVQFLIVLGGVSAVLQVAAAWRSRRVERIVTVGVCLAAVLTGSIGLAGGSTDNELRERLFYPMRMVFSYPIARTPDLATSRRLMETLRFEFGARVGNLTDVVHSPVAVSGFYGHHYLARVVEDETQIPAPPAGKVFVYDDRFPYDVQGGNRRHLGHMELVELAPERIVERSFVVAVFCSHKWCGERAASRRARPAVRFFWGCGEFRDLDERLSIPPEECEHLLSAPRHARWYQGQLRLPPEVPGCEDCDEVLFLGVSPDCRVLVELDGKGLSVDWTVVNERKYGFALVPESAEREVMHSLSVGIKDCVPYYFDLVEFTGRKREVLLNDE